MSKIGRKVPLASSAIPPGQRYGCAVFDFSASVPEELELEVGDVVKILGKVDDFWLRGLKLQNGRTGQFPQDFIKNIHIPSCSGDETLLYALDTFYPEASEDLPFDKGEIIILEKKINNEWGTGKCGYRRGMFPLNFTERLLPLTISSFESCPSSKTAPMESVSLAVPHAKGLGIARATMSLTAQLEEELSFCVDDEIIITDILEDGSWYKGQLGSNVGTFPASFVQLLQPLKAKDRPVPRTAPKVPLSRTGSKDWKMDHIPDLCNATNNNNNAVVKTSITGLHDIRNLNHQSLSEYRFAEDVMPPTVLGGAMQEKEAKLAEAKGDQKLPTKNKNVYTVTALYKFTGNTDRELSFEKGTRIPISEEVDDHWLMGEVGGIEGFIPRAYVSRMDVAQESNASSKTQKQENKEEVSTNGIGNKMEKKGVANNSDNSKNKNYVQITGSQLLNRHHVYTAPQPSNNHAATNSITSGDNSNIGLKKVLAIYDYSATNQFDLSIVTGDTLWILREVDENWCQVKNEVGKRGNVPTSYIQVAVCDDSESDVRRLIPPNEYTSDEALQRNVPAVGLDKANEYVAPIAKQIFHHPSSSNISTNSPVMPVLFEQANSDLVEGHIEKPRAKVQRQFAFTTAKPFKAYRPMNSWEKKPSSESEEQTPNVLKKSISVDSGCFSNIQSHSINRSNSNPSAQCGPRSRTFRTSTDPRVNLKVWQNKRQTGSRSGDQPLTPPNERSILAQNDSENAYEIPMSKFQRSSTRCASMREKKSVDQTDPGMGNFVKIRSDSDLSKAQLDRQRQRPPSEKARRNDPRSLSNISVPTSFITTKQDVSIRTGNRDSISTASTGSGSSFGESKTSLSTLSDTSGTDSVPGVSNHIAASQLSYRAAPPIPKRRPEERESHVGYPASPWSPPIPQRKQSLHYEAGMSSRDQPGEPASPIKTWAGTANPNMRITPPARPAPKPPVHVERNKVCSGNSTESVQLNQPEKKIPPKRPANPPMASPPASQSAGRRRVATSRETKEKMEKLRTDIEDYSRMKRDLESLYRGTLDGKERREISENKEFVKANLRRLEKEFHDLILDEQDHIYESIEVHMNKQPGTGSRTDFTTLPAPPLPQQPDSPGSIRKKRQERRSLVISEIVNTERDFLTDLTVTIEDIMYELADREIPQQTITTLFGNIEDVKNFAVGLLKEFEEALDYESSAEPKDPDGPTMGQVFIDNIPNMKDVYMTYCRNHDDAIAMLEKYETDSEFMQAVGNCLEAMKSKVNVFDLGSFLIKPVQRILKYPLLIGELVKLTDRPTASTGNSELDKLLLAAKMMQQVANDINEDKRTKDLVRKYKNASNEGLTEKLGKISIKSLKKKSGRISRRIGHVTGITTQGTKDAQFDEVERRFKTLERALKLFTNNISSYCDKCRDMLFAELNVAKAIVDMVYMPDRNHPVTQYQGVADKMSGPLYRQFHDQVQLRVLSPISSLLVSFKSPQAIIDKRYDKMLDYEQLQKNSDSKEKIQAAKHDYEALNKSLLEELPKLCDLGMKLLSSCTAIFAQVHQDFERKLLNVLNPILMTIQQSESTSTVGIPSNHEIQDRFFPCHSEAIHAISRLQLVPPSFGALIASGRGTVESQKRMRTSSSVKPSQDSPKVQPKQSQQPAQHRQALVNKYAQQQLYVASKNFTSVQIMDVACSQGDLVAVLKQQDPMGSTNRWFVDKGGDAMGFLPASILKAYQHSNEETLIKVPLGDSDITSSPNTNIQAPVPAPRQKSPTPSSRSTSSVDSSGTQGPSKAPISPFALRQTISGTLSRKSTSPNKLPNLLDDDVLKALEDEDEIFDEAEYEPLPLSSPSIAKQHFRAQFEFTARSGLELTLRTGDIVTLIMSHDTDGNSEWWLVSNAEAKQGYVPANYLSKAEYL